MEFYLTFWSVLGSDLVDVLNSCFDSGCLSLSQRRGVISLSLKKGDRFDPLLNVDYKLAAHVIAGRPLNVIHIAVDKDQTCGVPGRFIGENVALLRDVVYCTTSFRVPAVILSLDQEKAFDRVPTERVCLCLEFQFCFCSFLSVICVCFMLGLGG